MAEQLTVVIPAFNEEAAIEQVVEGLLNEGFPFIHEIIVVDDGSGDATAQVAQGAGACVIQHRRNMGYGAALKTGIRRATTEFVLTMDADGQHRAEDVGRLWDVANTCDMVVGARSGSVQSPLWRMPGKWLLGRMANYLTRHTIPDLNSGLRLMRKSIVAKYLHLCPTGFSFSTTISMALHSRGYNVVYVPVQVQRRIGKSMVSLAMGFETIFLILRIATLFDPLRVFLPISVVVGLLGLVWGVPYALAGHGISTGALLAILTSLILFSLGLLSDQISQLRLERFE